MQLWLPSLQAALGCTAARVSSHRRLIAWQVAGGHDYRCHLQNRTHWLFLYRSTLF